MSGTTQTQIDLLEMSPIQVVGVLHDVCIPPIADQAHHPKAYSKRQTTALSSFALG
jgi:hypothetical protein